MRQVNGNSLSNWSGSVHKSRERKGLRLSMRGRRPCRCALRDHVDMNNSVEY